ncbi:MAG: hypothetical protein K6G74_01825 [Bacilli bacterium]|nr:hypothetical protein [Bacilli bacterium]
MLSLRKKTFYRILVGSLIAILLSLVISLTSSDSISPVFGSFHGDAFSVDGVLFMYDAKAILAGKKPYLEVFDHKGLYHLFVDALGLLIGDSVGVLVLETIFGAVSLLLLFETLEKLEMSLFQKAVAVGFFATLRMLIGGGNAIGIWLLPWASAYLYFYIRAIKEEKERFFLIGSIFLGVEVALSFNSRPLDTIFVYGGMIYLLIKGIKEHKMGMFWMNALAAFLAFAIVSSVFVVIAISGGYLVEMLKATFLENFTYIGRTANFPLEQVFFRIGAGLLIVIAFVVYFLERKWGADAVMRNFLFTLFLSVFVPLIFLGRYLSYLLCGVTLFSICLSFFIKSIPEGKGSLFTQRIMASIFAAGIVLFGVLTPVLYYTTGVADLSYALNSQDEKALLETIPLEDRKDEKVFAIDCSCSVYLSLGTISEERFYANQSWWSLDNEEVIPEVITFIKTKKPTWIVLSKDPLSKENFGEALSDYRLISEKAARFDIYRLNDIVF